MASVVKIFDTDTTLTVCMCVWNVEITSVKKEADIRLVPTLVNKSNITLNLTED